MCGPTGGCAAAGPMGKMPRGQPRARKRPPGHAITGQRHSWRRRLKSATSATAVYCPDESCLTVLNGCVEKNRGCDRANGKIASPATVSRLGLGPLDLVVSDCRLQPFAFAQVEAVHQGGGRGGEGAAVRLAGLAGTNDVASPWRRGIGPRSAHGALAPDKSAVDTA